MHRLHQSLRSFVSSRLPRRLLPAALLCLSLSACDRLLPESPEDAIRAFYANLNRGELPAARKRYYLPDSGGFLDALLTQSLRTEIERTAACGGLGQLDIQPASSVGDVSQADVRVTYPKCRPLGQTIKLVRVDGRWQIQQFTTIADAEAKKRWEWFWSH